MADFISRDYTVENMENYPWDTEHDKNAAIHLVRELIPAADVRPVVKAHWIYHEDDCGDYYECSHCHDEYVVYEGGMCWKHCPTCGADMWPDKNGQIGEKNRG